MFNDRKLPSMLDLASTSGLSTATLSRRQFVFGATLIGSALMVGCRVPSSGDASTPAAAVGGKPVAGSPFEAYIAIAADGFVTVYASQFDMGQNVYHGLATLVAEELDVALDKVLVEGRAGNPKWYGWTSEQLLVFGSERDTKRLMQDFLGRPLDSAAILEQLRRMN